MKKKPLIDCLFLRYPTINRERLGALIACGNIRVNGEKVRDPRYQIAINANIESDIAIVSPETSYQATEALIPSKPWVSRGGDKLEAIIALWQIQLQGLVILDAGSSTGGFTHCALLHGARVVHALDVGYNQLDWRLRKLPQVHVLERTNIMGIEHFEPAVDLGLADLSFRTIVGPAKKILSLCRLNRLYALIKPQFERKYGIESDFDGIVLESEHQQILADVAERLAKDGIELLRINPCAIRGTHGNQEYFGELALPSDMNSSSDILRQSNLMQIKNLDLI